MARNTSRFSLSDINFITTDTQEILTAIVKKYEEVAERTLAEGDPIYLFLESISAVIVSLRNEVNQAARETTLAYATGGFLDAIGCMVGTSRLGATKAKTTLKFTLASPVETATYQIPEGTRVTDGNNHVFTTDELLIIQQGEQSATVTATAESEGTRYNGLEIGAINMMVEPLPGLSVSNLTASSGGSDAEDDETYANRIALAPESFSCAGPVGSYRYHALAAHPSIAEVSIITPVPGTVDVRPILKNGELPSEEILELVRKALNDESVRPLTDTVNVASPEPEAYAIDVEWSIAKADATLLTTITQQVADAVEEYRLWQRTMPGRDINPTKLISLMEQAGARYVNVKSPVFKKLTPTKIAIESSVTVTYLGAEDE